MGFEKKFFNFKLEGFDHIIHDLMYTCIHFISLRSPFFCRFSFAAVRAGSPIM